MHHFFVGPDQIGEDEIRITGEDVNHIRNVLRIRPGEQISVSDGASVTYRAEVSGMGEDFVTAKILWAQEADTELPCRITLLQALPKSDKMALIIQKAVELGVSEIVPMATDRAVVKLDEKRAAAKVSRWNAIAQSAAKQAMRSIVPDVRPVMGFPDAVAYTAAFDCRVIPYERAEGIEHTRELFSSIRPGDSVAVYIGPEGGFTQEEIALARVSSIEPVTLGRRILRTETAGMTVLSILLYLLEQ